MFIVDLYTHVYILTLNKIVISFKVTFVQPNGEIILFLHEILLLMACSTHK